MNYCALKVSSSKSVEKTSGIHSVHGEVASSNKKEAEKFKKEFSDLIKA